MDAEWFVCACGCHAYQVERIDWDDEIGRQVSISLWYRGSGWHWRWPDRLRHIWKVIRHGHADVEEVLLTPDEAVSFAAVVAAAAMDGNLGHVFQSMAMVADA